MVVELLRPWQTVQGERERDGGQPRRLCSRQADAMRPGTERDALMEKARLYRSYARMDNWVASRELQPPS
jgi:hypothetical protein